MTHDDPVELMRRLRAVLGSVPEALSGQPGPQCLTEDELAALADGSLGRTASSATLAHLAGCSRCRGAMASLARVLDDTDVVGATPVRRPRRFGRVAIPAAAAAVLLVAVLARQPTGDPAQRMHRAPPITALDQPTAIAPLGPGARPFLLRWSAVVGADRYRVTLFRDDGRVLYEGNTPDTLAILPDSLDLTAGQSYRWIVEARTGWDRWSSSRLFEFSIERPGDR